MEPDELDDLPAEARRVIEASVRRPSLPPAPSLPSLSGLLAKPSRAGRATDRGRPRTFAIPHPGAPHVPIPIPCKRGHRRYRPHRARRSHRAASTAPARPPAEPPRSAAHPCAAAPDPLTAIRCRARACRLCSRTPVQPSPIRMDRQHPSDRRDPRNRGIRPPYPPPAWTPGIVRSRSGLLPRSAGAGEDGSHSGARARAGQAARSADGGPKRPNPSPSGRPRAPTIPEPQQMPRAAARSWDFRLCTGRPGSATDPYILI